MRGRSPFVEQLARYGATAGAGPTLHLADQATATRPEFKPFDGRGRRVDQVEFHPSWHTLMALYREQGLIDLPFSDTPCRTLVGGQPGSSCTARSKPAPCARPP